MNRRTALIAVALLSLLGVIARVFTDVHFQAWKNPNAMEHKTIAISLVAGRGFTFGDKGYYGPTSVQSPPYPFLLAGAFKAFDAVALNKRGEAVLDPAHPERGAHAYMAMLLLNALAGGALVWLTWVLVRTIGGSALTAVVAAGLVAVWPTQVYAARTVQAVELITVGLTAMTILYYRATRGGGVGAWAGYAFVATTVTLVEPAFLPALVVSGLMMLFCRSLTSRMKIRNSLVMALAVVAVIGPWTVRNYIVHGAIIPVKGSFWVNVWKGANDSASGSDRLALTPAQRARARKENGSFGSDELTDGNHQYDMLSLEDRKRIDNQPEVVREAVFREFAINWIKANPHRFFQLCGIRLLKTLTVDWDNPRSYNLAYAVSRLMVILLTLGGVVVAISQRWSLGFPLMVFLTALGTYTVTLTAARFAFPFEVFQLAMGAGLITAVVAKVRGSSPAPVEVPAFNAFPATAR
jgi:hypothetical protein